MVQTEESVGSIPSYNYRKLCMHRTMVEWTQAKKMMMMTKISIVTGGPGGPGGPGAPCKQNIAIH